MAGCVSARQCEVLAEGMGVRAATLLSSRQSDATGPPAALVGVVNPAGQIEEMLLSDGAHNHGRSISEDDT